MDIIVVARRLNTMLFLQWVQHGAVADPDDHHGRLQGTRQPGELPGARPVLHHAQEQPTRWRHYVPRLAHEYNVSNGAAVFEADRLVVIWLHDLLSNCSMFHFVFFHSEITDSVHVLI